VTTKAAILRACVAYQRGDLEGMLAAVQVAAEDRAAQAGQALSFMLIGLAAFFRGDLAGARRPFERSRDLARTDWRQVYLTSTAALTSIHAGSGELASAERLLAATDALMSEHGFEDSPTAALAYTSRGQVLEVRGDLEGAEAAYVHAAVIARRDAWPLDLVHALVHGAHLRRRRKDLAGARALAREARAVLGSCPDPGLLPERVEKLERTLQLAQAATADGRGETLSERELAVLRLLATDLSQREIGAQLFVSFNTVKTHTRTVFRKLGVASRADAVEKAREQGLL
jgi:LuxR family maltose regulon positive regulatory protein